MTLLITETPGVIFRKKAQIWRAHALILRKPRKILQIIAAIKCNYLSMDFNLIDALDAYIEYIFRATTANNWQKKGNILYAKQETKIFGWMGVKLLSGFIDNNVIENGIKSGEYVLKKKL